ncbi:dihydrodipicolinate synthase family protein [Arundinibacter roseus]|uniref:Dihydrodipicolinate synthase family protein n=1 Tax=Arundinibacter roseus TaxID=2070510 RepID=A0A4R4K352_9BACT|nr:dihydrodipicolinate synthase family protein [Arundinibacter roseus]TDB61784.1 dihydrodipicolinate synthase family protein [Arundinibacter roseus]
MRSKLPGGLWPVMITPFTEKNELDQHGLEALTNFYIKAGSNGLFANCLSSEMYQLTERERLQLVQSVLRYADGKVPVAATGTLTRDLNENIDFIKKMYDTGVQAVVMISSLLVLPDENEDIFKTRLEQILRQTEGIPLGLYECPVPYKRLLSAELMQWLVATDRFVYHKDTACHSGQIERKRAATAGSSLLFMNADTATALDSLTAGGDGLSPISANFYPELYTYLLQEFQANGRTEALERFHEWLTLMDRTTHTFYPYSAKWFLQQRGLPISTHTRIPTDTPPQVDWIRFRALLNAFRDLAERHSISLVL